MFIHLRNPEFWLTPKNLESPHASLLSKNTVCHLSSASPRSNEKSTVSHKRGADRARFLCLQAPTGLGGWKSVAYQEKQLHACCFRRALLSCIAKLLLAPQNKLAWKMLFGCLSPVGFALVSNLCWVHHLKMPRFKGIYPAFGRHCKNGPRDMPKIGRTEKNPRPNNHHPKGRFPATRPGLAAAYMVFPNKFHGRREAMLIHWQICAVDSWYIWWECQANIEIPHLFVM